jgi:hypothetical protein
VKNALCSAVTSLVNQGIGPGRIVIYAGVQPGSPESSPAGPLLASLLFAGLSFRAPQLGVSTANVITTGTIAATDIASWARITDGSGGAIFDVDIGQGSGSLSFPSVNFEVGELVTILQFQVAAS